MGSDPLPRRSPRETGESTRASRLRDPTGGFGRFRLRLIAQASLIALTALLLAFLIVRTGLFYAPVAVGLTLLAQVWLLVRTAEGAVRDVTHFLESIRAADFTQLPRSPAPGPLLGPLSRAYGSVMEEFRRIRADREAQYRFIETVVRHIGVALITYRSDGAVELLNPAARRLLNVSRLRTLRDLAPAFDPLVKALLEPASDGPAVVKVTLDDREHRLAVSAVRFRLQGRSYLQASIQDIRSELEEREIEAWQQLTRVLTHEIMNSAAPIASLATTVREWLRDEAAPSGAVVQDMREALEAIEVRSRALVRFTDSYRSFTHLQPPALQEVPVRDLLGRVRALLGRPIAQQGIRLDVAVDPEDLEVTADPEMIEQVLINVLLNAMEALEGQADARIVVRGEAGRLGQPSIRVIDNGPGIPIDVKEHVFVPFFTTRAEGSGIGLSLSRQIMHLHGGTLDLRSEPGVETVLTLRF